MNRPPHVIDVDDCNTWPDSVICQVEEWAKQWQGRTRYTGDIGLREELEKSFRSLFVGYRVLAFHFTRLFDHEREMIESQGLRLLTRQLIVDRIEAAKRVGVISENDASALLSKNVFEMGYEGNREKQVCLVLSRNVYKSTPENCEPLMNDWGGESIYSVCKDEILMQKLRDSSKPCKVGVAIDIAADSAHAVFPSSHKIFVGCYLDLCDAGGDVFYRAAIPPECIIDVTTMSPGSSRWRIASK